MLVFFSPKNAIYNRKLNNFIYYLNVTLCGTYFHCYNLLPSNQLSPQFFWDGDDKKWIQKIVNKRQASLGHSSTLLNMRMIMWTLQRYENSAKLHLGSAVSYGQPPLVLREDSYEQGHKVEIEKRKKPQNSGIADRSENFYTTDTYTVVSVTVSGLE